MRIAFLTAIFGLAAICLRPAGVRADAIDDALEQLNKRNIAFTSAEFVDLVERNDDEGVKIFLQAGMDPNTTKDGVPLLMGICQKGFDKTVKVLLEGGANPNVQNDRGWTPLHFAVVFNHLETAQLLLEHKAKSGAQTDYGMTPLHFATQERNPEMVQLLLKYGASATVKSKSGITPLSIAVDLGEKPIVRIYEGRGFKAQMAAIRASRKSEDAAIRADQKRKADERKKEFDERMKHATGNAPPQ